MSQPDPTAGLNRSAYDRIAPHFAQVNAAMPPEVEAAAQRLLERAKERGSPAPMLDLGCGAGRDLAWFTAQGLTAIGCDLSSGMLVQARQVTRSALCQMEMRSLGWASGSFQAVWCCAALLHLPKQAAPRALAEIARVLLPGGDLFLSVQKGSGEIIERAPYPEEIERFFARYVPDEMAVLLEQAGFQILARRENTAGRHWLWFEAQRLA